MSVKHSLLALLSEGPQYGAALRGEFEARTGGTWPLNVGQVYTTLARLERDGLVTRDGEPDGDDATIRYALTDAGAGEVSRWWTEPVDRTSTPRQELAIKLALAVTVGGVDVPRLVQTQRRASMQHLQELTRLKRITNAPGHGSGRRAEADLPWELVLENLIFTAEAELRWLDHVEGRLTRAAASAGRHSRQHAETAGPGATTPAVTGHQETLGTGSDSVTTGARGKGRS